VENGGGGGGVTSVNGQVGIVVLVPSDLGLGPTDNVTFGSVTAENLTPNTALVSNGSDKIISSTTTATELGYVSGVTSSIQTQLNGKQASGSYITALTGDATAAGPGSVPITLATVNGNVGTFSYPTVTVNAKGLTTAVTTPTQSANTVFSGPSSGAAAIPTFRALVIADLPVNSGSSFITSGTTYTTPASINTNTNFKFTLIGGGGGGASSNTASIHSPGGGAGGGLILFTSGLSPSTAYTIAVGAAGTGGASGATGGAGGDTTLTIGATTYTASGGKAPAAAGSGPGGTGGTATNGTINITGGSGGATMTVLSSAGLPGANGVFGFGFGGAGIAGSTSGSGNAATGYGAGGGGSSSNGAPTGGAGSAGCILVEWKS